MTLPEYDHQPVEVPDEPADPADQGGEPVCWLPRVCPECGRLADDPPTRCPRCGAEISVE
jgi:rubrerythrin